MVPVPTPHTPAVSGPRQQAWIRALDRARLVATRKPTYLLRLDAYRVHSERVGADYLVRPTEVDGQFTYHCDCAAGMSGAVCWHAAVIAALPYECARRAAHRATARPVTPPPAVPVVLQSRQLAGIAPSLAECF